MTTAPRLPRLMVAPNGARRTPADHPAVPVTIAQIVDTARSCYAAGAGGIHAHVRDADGAHVLDPGLYRELIAELARVVPDMFVQITTEAVGRYSPAQQRAVVRDAGPGAASVSLREMLSGGDIASAQQFYHWAAESGIAVQHVLYAPAEFAELLALARSGIVPPGPVQVLFVLGRYTPNRRSTPADLPPYLAHFAGAPMPLDWAVCAFGHAETACLAAALNCGGKARVGFENNLLNADGNVAGDNAARVAEIAAIGIDPI